MRIGDVAVIIQNVRIRLNQYEQSEFPLSTSNEVAQIIQNERIHVDVAQTEYKRRSLMQDIVRNSNIDVVMYQLLARNSILSSEAEHERLIESLTELNFQE